MDYCGTRKKVHVFWTNHLLSPAQTLWNESTPNEIADKTQMWKPRQPRTDGLCNPNRSIADRAAQKNLQSQIVLCWIDSRSYFHFRSAGVAHTPGIKRKHQTLGAVQLPDKGIKLVGLAWSTVSLYFQNTKFRASIPVAMATWYICSRVSFPITISWAFSFFPPRTLPNFKTLVAEATSPFKGKRSAVPICAEARARLWRPACYGKVGGVREAKKIPREARGEEGTVLQRGNTRLRMRQVGQAPSGRLQA